MTEPVPVLDLFSPLRATAPLDRLVAAFATRVGGVSASPFDSCNLGFSTGDDRDAVVENRRRFVAALDVPLEACVVPGQCHGAEVVAVTRGDRGEGARAPSERLRGRDAVLLEEPGVFALSLSADCPLVVVADPRAGRAGVAHAGWRGTAAGVIGGIVGAMTARGSRPENLWGAVGPGICGACFEVGEEVFAAVASRPGASAARRGRMLDLRAIHCAELLAAGIPEPQVTVSSLCSVEEPVRLFSHRRDRGETGRNGALVGWHREEDGER